MYRHIVCLASLIPLLSSCPDSRFRPVEYAITDGDRLAIKSSIGGYFDKTTNVEFTTTKGSQLPDFAPLRITVCGSFVLSDANTGVMRSQTYRFSGVLSDTNDGMRAFDVSSLDKIEEGAADAGASPRESAQRITAPLCP
jgi:hypothetical protein